MFLRKALVLASLSPLISIAQPNANQLSGSNPLNAITTAMPFLGINAESRGGAMGDAGTALSPNANSLYWNTAMLNFAKSKSEVGLSYVPWLRQLTNDIHLSYLAGYTKVGSRHVIGGSLRYFSLGEITFTSNDGSVIRKDKPSEFEIALGYAFKLSERSSIGVNGKFAYSNLTGGLTVEGTQTKAGVAGIADISYAYRNEDINWFGVNGVYAFGVNIANIGNKIQYSVLAQRDFLPQQLKIGNAYTANIDKYNSLTISFDIQKLLVPTPPIRSQAGDVLSGKNNDVGVIGGLVQSFYDAPGTPIKDDNGDYIMNPDGSIQVKKGSKFGEEMREINLAAGLEYWYNNIFAVRAGYFHEHYTKGGRQFFTAGIGFQYNMFCFDFSYLMALKRNNPLANTLRFSIRFKLGDNNQSTASDKPE